MEFSVNQFHPRMKIDGKLEKIPLCINSGSLRLNQNAKKELYGIDELGLGVSLYFKLLKSLVFFFVVVAIINIPIYYIYSQGEMKKASTTSWLSYLTIGNIG